MPTYYFPSALEKLFGFEMSPGIEEKTEYSEAYGGGAIQTQAVYPAPRHRFVGPTFYFDRTQRKTFRQFQETIRGRANPWYFFFPDSWEFDNLLIGYSTAGPGQQIVMPLKESSISTLYVDGVSKAFSFSASVGTGGEDRVTITNAQTAGKAVTVAGYGRYRFKARFETDQFMEEWWADAQSPLAAQQFTALEEFELY